jgi:hypothetical protein
MSTTTLPSGVECSVRHVEILDTQASQDTVVYTDYNMQSGKSVQSQTTNYQRIWYADNGAENHIDLVNAEFACRPGHRARFVWFKRKRHFQLALCINESTGEQLVLPALDRAARKLGAGSIPYVMVAGTLIMAGSALYAREFMWSPILLVGGYVVSAATDYALMKPARRRLITEAAAL